MKTVVFHPEAVVELEEAVAWYAERSVRVARSFEEAVESGVRSIQSHPSRYAFLRKTGKRAFRVPRFPYLVIYEETSQHIWIDAVAHEKRHPDYWKSRRGAS